MRTDGRFVRGYAGRYEGHITCILGAVRAGVPYVPCVESATVGVVTEHNTSVGIREGIELPAPSQVVAPACGGDAAATEECDPVGFLGLRNPRPLHASVLAERHDVAHGRGVYAL